MGLSLKSIGKGLKKVAKIAAPVVGAINPIAGIALGAASGLGEGKNSLKSMGMGAAGGAIGGIGGAALKGAGGAGNVLRSVGNFAKGNPELLLGGAQMIQGARQQSAANKLQQQALDQAQQPWKETSPLRSIGMSLLANQQQSLPQFSLGEEAPSSNPFARRQSGFGSFSR